MNIKARLIGGAGLTLAAGMMGLLARGMTSPARGASADSSTASARPVAFAPLRSSHDRANSEADASAGAMPAKAALQARFDREVQPVLEQYCFHCHGNGKHKGDISLDHFKSFAAIQADRRTWQSVQGVIELGMMPPDDKPQPAKAQVKNVANFIDDAMNWCDLSAPRDPGRVLLHRLNRDEYNNTVRDLLGINFGSALPAADFPADDTGYGFDNIADVLSVSPMLAEKYLSSAEQVMDRAIPADNATSPHVVHVDAAKFAGTIGQDGGDGWELYSNGEAYIDRAIPATGEYELHIRAEADEAGTEAAKMTLKVDSHELRTFDVTAQRGQPANYTLRTKLTFGTHRLAAAFINDFYDPKASNPKRRDRNLVVCSIDIDGPFNAVAPPPTPSERAIFVATPGRGVSEDEAAQTIIAKFVSRAFRRPQVPEVWGRYVRLYKQSRLDGATFKQSVKVALTAVLVSPQFLYRVEIDPPASAGGPAIHRIDDYELATRLSYFLWSSMGDDELYRFAAAGKLHERPVLEQQVRRMIADPRSDAFVKNFVGQWLELRNLDSVNPNAKVFPAFDGTLRRAMRTEAQMLFADVLRENHSALDLIDAKYTFLNARLAKLYGIPNVNGSYFRKVDLAGVPNGEHRGGVLTMAGVLTVTSMSARTSPVKRGKWVLEEILGDPPPPPPGNISALPTHVSRGDKLTMRQHLEQHRADMTCASCHARMDPLGFAMENFDGIGAWRTMEGGRKIDTSGKLPDGTEIDSAQQLKQLLVTRKKSAFIRCLTEKMMTYALGRGLEDYDRPTVYDIRRSVERNDCRMISVVDAIVESDAFQERRMGPPLNPPLIASPVGSPTTRPAQTALGGAAAASSPASGQSAPSQAFRTASIQKGIQ